MTASTIHPYLMKYYEGLLAITKSAESKALKVSTFDDRGERVVKVSSPAFVYEIRFGKQWLGADFLVNYEGKQWTIWRSDTDVYELTDPDNAWFVEEVYQEISAVLEQIVQDKVKWQLDKKKPNIVFYDGKHWISRNSGRFIAGRKPQDKPPADFAAWLPLSKLAEDESDDREAKVIRITGKAVATLSKEYNVKFRVLDAEIARRAGFGAGWEIHNNREPHRIEVLVSNTELLFAFDDIFSDLNYISTVPQSQVAKLVDDYVGGFLKHGVYSKPYKTLFGRVKTKRYVRSLSGEETRVG